MLASPPFTILGSRWLANARGFFNHFDHISPLRIKCYNRRAKYLLGQSKAINIMSLLTLLVGLVFVIVVTPVIRQVAIHYGFVAVPKSNRAHKKITPLMGGVALYIGLIGAIFLLSIFLTVFDVRDKTWSSQDLYITFFISVVLGMVGLVDDRQPLKPMVKIGCQAVLVIALLLTTDTEVHLPNFGDANFFITLCWFLYVINAFNYMDNMDGTAAMTATVSAMFFTVIATITGQFMVSMMASAIAGISVGFLRYNLFTEEKKIFMGDAGSLFLGFWLAVIGLKLSFPVISPLITWPVPVLVLGIPIFDTALVFVSRYRRGLSFLQGGTDHLSHRLGRYDLGRYGVPFALGFINMTLGCVAILIMHSSILSSVIMQIVVGLNALYAFYVLELKADYEFITGQAPPSDSFSPSSNPKIPTTQIHEEPTPL
jgi:UDP-GlcNAc:undecaprenyl-phosphate GlcNAc-1-phosphate transferase